ncbi:MAG: ankyrin repeat domain-containing protein [Anaerolineae bacterium]
MMSSLKNKIAEPVAKLIRKALVCFCSLLGSLNGELSILDFPPHFGPAQRCERLQEDLFCQFPQLSPDLFQALTQIGLFEETVNTLRPLIERGCLSQSTTRTTTDHLFVHAAAKGNLETLRFLFKKMFVQSPCFFDRGILNNCCLCAAANGHVEVFHFLFKEIFPQLMCFLGDDILNSCCLCAAANGHLEMFNFLLTEVFPQSTCFLSQEMLESCSIGAAANGHLKMLHFLLTEVFPQTTCFLDQRIVDSCCLCAAANGHLETLHFLLDLLHN